MKTSKLIAAGLLCAALMLVRANANPPDGNAGPANASPDWNQWRGPSRSGASEDADWNPHWGNDGPPRLWTATIGDGYSGVVVSGEHAYTCGEGPEVQKDGQTHHVELLYCFDTRTGAVVWQTPTSPTSESKRYGCWTCATPIVDHDSVYMLGRWGWLMAVDAASGKVRWTRDLLQEVVAAPPSYGQGSSPLIIGDALVLNAGSRGMALDKRTGKTLWKSDGKYWPCPSPVPAKFNGRDVALLTCDHDALRAVDPLTGAVAWQYPLSAYPESGPPYSDPIIDGNHILTTTVYGSVLLSFTGDKGSLVAKPAYAAGVCNPCLWHGHAYGFRAKDGLKTPSGTLVCLDLETGKICWEQPNLDGTLIMAGGRLIIQTLSAQLITADVSPDGYHELSRGKVLDKPPADPMVTAPALCNGHIYCRLRTAVVCLDVKSVAGDRH